MLKPPMGGAGVDKVGERELVDITQALKWSGINDLSLVTTGGDESMNGVAKLVLMLRHVSPHQRDSVAS